MTRERIKSTHPSKNSNSNLANTKLDVVNVNAKDASKHGNKRRHSRNENISDHPEALRKRQEALLKEVNAGCFKPISFEIYKKTPAEKAALKVAKANHKAAMANRKY